MEWPARPPPVGGWGCVRGGGGGGGGGGGKSMNPYNITGSALFPAPSVGIVGPTKVV